MSAPETAQASETDSRASRVGRWLDTRFRSAASIYGLIVFAAFITISSDHAQDAWDMLDTSLWTLAVFYLAHVFAHTLTDHGEQGLAKSSWHAMQQAAGMLYAAVPAAIVLVVCGVQDVSVEDSYVFSMWATTAVLAVLGYGAYWRRGAHPFVRLLGAAGTAALGLIIILLEYAIH